jgi:hypothetical protein
VKMAGSQRKRRTHRPGGGQASRAGKAVTRMHKFNVGQIVQFHPNRNERFTAPAGAYEITKRLPHNGQEYEYRIKSAQEGHERTARESQLSNA